MSLPQAKKCRKYRTKASLPTSEAATKETAVYLLLHTQNTIHASLPHSVTLMQLHFTSFVVINLQRDLHPQECAHAGRTNKKRRPKPPFCSQLA